METTNSLPIDQCCVYYNIEVSFLQQLNDHGLIELDRSGEAVFISYEQLPELEKYMHFHYELDINMEGMEVIKHLLTRMQDLQQEMKRLQNEAGRN